MLTTDRGGSADESARIVSALIVPGMTTLDLGCGEAPFTKHLRDVVHIDLKPHVTQPDRLIVADIRDVPVMYAHWRFGTCFLLDVLEHLTKDDGSALLRDLEALCQRIVVFTPTGELWVTPDEGDPHSHRCGWTPVELEALGYHVWEWPRYHEFPDGNTHGAFWAWKCLCGPSLTPEELAAASEVEP
jgi:hypothetical protein